MSRDGLSLCPTDAHGLESLADLFTRCFEGYLVEMTMTSNMFAEYSRVDHLDLSACRIVREADQEVALGLISRRSGRARVAAMGVIASHRGRGVGRWLMRHLIDESRARGDRTLQLEVIEQNTPARKLYETSGFAARRRLVGFRCSELDAQDDEALEWIEPREVAAAMMVDGVEDVGWILSPDSVLGYAPPHRAVRLGPAVALVSEPVPPLIALECLYVPQDARRRGWGGRLLRCLAARFPDVAWRVRAVVPEDLGDAFLLKTGFEREELTQLEMMLEL